MSASADPFLAERETQEHARQISKLEEYEAPLGIIMQTSLIEENTWKQKNMKGSHTPRYLAMCCAEPVGKLCDDRGDK